MGKPHTLWIAFAKFYERHGDIVNARVIFDKATQVELKYMDDLATVWCEWAEMELRHKNFKQALSLMRRATQPPATLGTRQVWLNLNAAFLGSSSPDSSPPAAVVDLDGSLIVA